MNYAGNSFSLQMIDEYPATVKIEKCQAPNKIDCYSVFGHKDIAEMAGFECNRESVHLKKGDVLYVFQILNYRLPEGVTVLPENVEKQWIKVYII